MTSPQGHWKTNGWTRGWGSAMHSAQGIAQDVKRPESRACVRLKKKQPQRQVCESCMLCFTIHEVHEHTIILYDIFSEHTIDHILSECITMYAWNILYLSCSPLDSTVVRPTVLGTARPTSRKSSWGYTWKIGAAPRNATRHWSQRRRRSALALRPLEKSLLRCLENWDLNGPCTCKYVICVLYILCIMSYVLICFNIHKGWRWCVLLCLLWWVNF